MTTPRSTHQKRPAGAPAYDLQRSAAFWQATLRQRRLRFAER
jgi:hypothetical protein